MFEVVLPALFAADAVSPETANTFAAVLPYLWLIPGLPLMAAVVIGLLGPKFLKQHSHWPCVLACAGSFVLACMLFQAVYGAVPHVEEGLHTPTEIRTEQAHARETTVYYTWFQAGEVNVPFALRADPLTAIMIPMITFIGTLICIFSIGYMQGERGYPRFFSGISLFVAAMCLLVLGDNLLVLFIGWEGVGLCSYLLIGYWFSKPSASDAARKAFLMTRLGDAGMILGILMVWAVSGYHFDYDNIFRAFRELMASDPATYGPIVFSACLLLFCGCVGKSAQFPLHVWLPDAMEGPTPVSALIHAATMVTAGVFLVARFTPLFVLSPEAQLTVAIIGGITMLLAALIALTQTDLKRVLAYSTLSQLGYMFLALGCAVNVDQIATFAVTAAMFHLITHAFFKALLFLGSGSVMHAMHHVIDMRKFSGLRTVLPITHWTFLAGAVALAGLPPFSGFWSKDEIIAAAWEASEHARAYNPMYFTLYLTALATAGLTAFYTFRAYFLTFWGPTKLPEELHGHPAHESPPVMTVPLIILSLGAIFAGVLLGPTGWFAHLAGFTLGFPTLPHAHSPNYAVMVISSIIGIAGLGVAYLFYVTQPTLPGKLASSAKELYQLSYNKFHFDELYNAFVVKPLEGFAEFLRIIDLYVVDQIVDLVGQFSRLIGYLFRPLQNGLVQFYALAMVMGLTVFLLALARSL